MQYNIEFVAEEYFFFIKKIYSLWGWGIGILKPVGNMNEIWFHIFVEYGRVPGKYLRIGYEDGECKLCSYPAHYYAYSDARVKIDFSLTNIYLKS